MNTRLVINLSVVAVGFVLLLTIGLTDWKIATVILSASLAVLLLINKNILRAKTRLVSFKPLKDKAITFATPHRVEMILLLLFMFTFFIADLAQNKFLDKGLDYEVIVFWQWSALALDVWVVFLVLFHLSLMALFLHSLSIKRTHNFYDVIVGVIALFGVAILLAGAIQQIYSDTIRFLFMDMRSIDFYHIGVYIEMGAALYWALTD